jgi:hypothetical protein
MQLESLVLLILAGDLDLGMVVPLAVWRLALVRLEVKLMVKLSCSLEP